MGVKIIDNYTLSHFVGGMLMQRMGLSRPIVYSLAILYEILENYIIIKYYGGRCISIKYILPVVDCKTKPDSLENMISDCLFYFIGYELAKLIDIKYMPMFPKNFRWLIPLGPFLLSLLTTNIIGKTPDDEMKVRK